MNYFKDSSDEDWSSEEEDETKQMKINNLRAQVSDLQNTYKVFENNKLPPKLQSTPTKSPKVPSKLSPKVQSTKPSSNLKAAPSFIDLTSDNENTSEMTIKSEPTVHGYPTKRLENSSNECNKGNKKFSTGKENVNEAAQKKDEQGTVFICFGFSHTFSKY